MVSAHIRRLAAFTLGGLLLSACPESSTPPSPCGDARIDFRLAFSGEPAIEGCRSLTDGYIVERYWTAGGCGILATVGRGERADGSPFRVELGALESTFRARGTVPVFISVGGGDAAFCGLSSYCAFRGFDCVGEVVTPGGEGDSVEVRLVEACMLQDPEEPDATRIPTVEWLVMRGPVRVEAAGDAGLPTGCP